MLLAHGLALVLATPTEVFEEWALSPSTPMLEVVTVGAVYSRRDGAVALLPESLRGEPRPEVYASGSTRALRVTWGPRGWQCALPPGERTTVHLRARVSRTPTLPRMFRARWPEVRANTAPTRRVAIVPRDWIESTPRGWTCVEDAEGDVPCVSHERLPSPIVARVSSPASPPGSWPLATTLTAATFSLLAWSPTRRAERVVAALGGAAVALSVALALVGAHASSWGVATAKLVPIGAAVGTLAPRTRWGRALGAASLVFIPSLAVAGAPAAWVFSLAALLAAAVLGAAAGGAS